MLETHLSEAPRDVDARLLYGLVLSWEGRYDEARPVLQQVLTQAPAYTDARVALMNVEYWSGHSAAALEQADRILADSARQRHRPRGSRSNRGGEPSVVGRDDLHARRVRRWNGPVAGGLGVADAPDRRRLADRALEPRRTIRTAGQLLRRGVLPAVQARHVRLRRPRRGAGIGTFPVSPVSRGLRPVSVARPRLRSVGRCALHGLLRSSRRFTSARSRSTSATGCGPESSTTSPAKATSIRTPTSAGSAATSAATGPATSGSTTVTASAVKRSAASRIWRRSTPIRSRGEFDVLLGSRTRLSGSAGVSHQERPNRSPVWQTTITAGLSVQFLT